MCSKSITFLRDLLALGVQLSCLLKYLLQLLLILHLLRLVACQLLLCLCQFVPQQSPVCCRDCQAQLQDLALLL